MMRALFAISCVAPTSACMADQPVSGGAAGLACTATQSCTTGGDCTPSDLEFNLAQGATSGLTITLSDGATALAFVETTSAGFGDTPISLTTYEANDQSIRLTLADDGTTSTRARLQRAPDTDISAMCVATSGASQ